MSSADNRSAYLARSGWIILIVIASAALSRWLAPGQSLSLAWAPAGFIFAFAWKYGAWTLIPSTAGLVVWGALAYPAVPWVGAAAAVADAACTLSACAMLRYLLSRTASRTTQALERSMPQLRWLVGFYVAAFGVGAVAAATVGATGFALAGLHTSLSYVEIWIAYWVIQAVGLLLYAPLMLAWLGAAPADANAIPFAPRSDSESFASLVREKLDALSVLAVLLLTAIMLAFRLTGRESFVSPMSLAYIPAVAFCAMRGKALTTYLTLAVSGTLLGVTLSFDSSVMSFERPASDAKVPITVFQTIVLIFVSSLLAQLLQAVSSDREEALQRLQEQSSRDALTGLANEVGLGNWLAARDANQSWLIVGVFFGTSQRLGAILGPVRLITVPQFIAQHMRSFGATLTARTDSARYVLAFLDTTQSMARIVELRRAFNHFVASDKQGEDVAMHGTIRVLRLHPGDQPNSLLVMSTLATLSDRQQSTEPSAISVHDFSGELQESLRRQTQRNEQIRGWILANQIELFAQAIHPSQNDGAAHEVAVEVLCRLRDDEGQLVEPADFFEVANQAGLAAQLDRQIITAVFTWFRQRPDALAITRKCAINLSPASLSDPEFVGFVRRLVREQALPTSRFCFEITESNAIADVEQSRGSVQELRSEGFRVSIDDFGTGFATYSYLKRYDVDEIKIDGTFVTKLGENKIDIEIVKSIVRVAKMLNVKTVAEFVATEALRVQVQQLGVDFVQGYAVGRPQPIASLYPPETQAKR
jgi:EAL domain-containing protein (putative c-di-GMP-specific phosphodiesterase class I)